MSPETKDALIDGVVIAFGAIFWIWVIRAVWRSGYRPFGVILLDHGAQRVSFAVKWLLFLRRRKKVDAFLDEAERRKRHPIAGLIEDK